MELFQKIICFGSYIPKDSDVGYVDGGCQLFLKKSQKMKIPASSFRVLGEVVGEGEVGEATAAPGGLCLCFM